MINGHSVNALLDSGSTDKSFIDNNIVKSLKLKVYPESGFIGLATSAMSCKIIGYCVDISLQNRNYEQFKLSILDNLCADIILGTDFQSLHKNIVI